ncbi:MAG: hypothetical protein IPH48_12595 [bacterium]|nr:hypothetical protein [bacterium]
MMRNAALVLLAALAGLALAGAALAQLDPPAGTSVLMTASCAGDDVLLSIDFTVTAAPPAGFVGWVVECEMIGLCAPVAQVTGVLPWPALGQTHLDLSVTPDNAWFDALYRILAVDVDGNRTVIAWPQRQHYAHAECLPGPTVVGRFVEIAGTLYFESCTEMCWPVLSWFDGTYPPGAAALAGTGQVMALYGELLAGMEGPYINASRMEPSFLPCDAVSEQSTTWGGVKATYR